MQMVKAFRRAVRPAVRVGLVILAAAGALTIASRCLISRLIYQPILLTEAEASPRRWGIANAEVLHIITRDRVRLYGWWLSHRRGQIPPCGTAIMFYGNKGNMVGRRVDAESLARRGLDVILFDYRGYGASHGTPSENGFYADAEAVYRYVETRTGAHGRIFLLGHSLGAAVATHLAADKPAAGLILVAPFTSLLGAARARVSHLADVLLTGNEYRFDSADVIGRVRMPILIIVGTQDRLVSASDARALFAASPEPKTWVEVPDAGHNDVFDRATFWDGIERFVKRVRCAADQGSRDRPT